MAASKVDMPHLPWHPKEEPPPVISCRRRLPGRCLISWWIPPQLQLARHFTLGHKQTTPNPAHISWTNGLSPFLGKTKAIIRWVSRHERLQQCKQKSIHQAYSFVHKVNLKASSGGTCGCSGQTNCRSRCHQRTGRGGICHWRMHPGNRRSRHEEVGPATRGV